MIEKFVDPYNRKDLDALVALYHPDAELSFFVFPPQRAWRRFERSGSGT